MTDKEVGDLWRDIQSQQPGTFSTWWARKRTNT